MVCGLGGGLVWGFCVSGGRVEERVGTILDRAAMIPKMIGAEYKKMRNR